MPQVFPPVRNPTKSTLIGDDAAAVVGSTTTMFSPSAAGAAELSEIVSSDTSNGTITNGTGLESAPGVPGFSTWTVNVPGDCTSVGFSTVAHEVTLEQLVPRPTPLTRIVDEELPIPATKFTPRTASGKASTSPVMVLDGRIASIAGPLEIEMVADANFVGSAS